MFEIYTFEITLTFPRGQWVKSSLLSSTKLCYGSWHSLKHALAPGSSLLNHVIHERYNDNMHLSCCCWDQVFSNLYLISKLRILDYNGRDRQYISWRMTVTAYQFTGHSIVYHPRPIRAIGYFRALRCLSVRPSVRPSVPPSLPPYSPQYFTDPVHIWLSRWLLYEHEPYWLCGFCVHFPRIQWHFEILWIHWLTCCSRPA